MRINTNIASLNAQANASQTNSKLSSSLEKLSSGLQINKAADDASGMAIADKLRTQASSLGQGISNANSASALITIADKAMSEQSNILDIVKTKLIQASTSTTSSEGREAVRKDISKLLEQFDNISGQTNYNGVNLLNEKGAEFSFQVGEDASFDIGLSTAYAVNTSGLGSTQQLVSDDESIIDYKNDVFIDKIGTSVEVQHDPDTTVAAGHSRGIMVGGTNAPDTVGGTVSVEIQAENVKALTFDTNGTGSITLETTDVGLMAEMDAFAASVGTITKNSDGVYTLTDGADYNLEFGSAIDVKDLKVSGLIVGVNAAATTTMGVISEDMVTVTKSGGAGQISLDSVDYTEGNAVTAATSSALSALLVGKASNSADGLAFDADGVIVEEGTLGVQYNPDKTTNSTSQAAVTVNTASTTATDDDISYTVNAENVTMISMEGNTAGDSQNVIISTTNSESIAVLDQMAEDNSLLTRINSGSYVMSNADNTEDGATVLDFGNEGFDMKSVTFSGIRPTAGTEGEAISFVTEEQVNITKSGDKSSEPHILVTSGTASDTGAMTAGTTGTLIGANAETMSQSQTLSGLKGLEENELTADVANKFMAIIDSAMTQLNSVRSDFGSTQGQLEVSTRNMMTTQVNIKAAESVIRDVDYAAESANFNKQNIIAQAGTYAMSQANSMQQNVMRLLQ